ncbi:MAG TPA: efflux RND transporter periplasmic adaptor subunit [Chitinophaga sp.]
MRFFAGSIFLLVTAAACHEQAPQADSVSKESRADSVKAFVLTVDSAKKTLVLPGELLPKEDAQIRAKVQGYIRKMNVDIGSKVTKGQVLALIDAPEINSRVEELNQKVKAARARYLSSKDYYDRIYIAAKAEGVIAPSELERVKNQMMADSLEYSAVSFAATSNRQIGTYLAIVAPYKGIITKRNIVTGSFVGIPNEKPLFELADNSLLRLRVAVPEVYSNAVLLNNIGELSTRALPDKKFKAQLVRKAGNIDHETRSEVWEFEIPNTIGELKPGSYADVKLQFLRQQQTFTVPASAVTTTLEKKFVIRISNGLTQWVDVRPGFNMGDKLEIFGELQAGDTLVLKGNEELKPDARVIATVGK